MQLFPERLVSSSQPILEIGCGTGLYSRYLVEYFEHRYWGSDVSPGMIAQAREAGIPNLVEGDAGNLPFDAGHFCALFGFGVLHHVPAQTHPASNPFV